MKNLKSFIITITATLTINGLRGQDYGNEWINYSQSYYKIQTAQDGLFRITYDDLQQAGFPVSSVDPRRIRLYHRGEEQAIYFEGQLDASFDPDDYLEFYGRKNDGILDEELYVEPVAQPHKYYSIYTDTTAYFLTWNPASNGKRMDYFKENNVSGLPVEPYSINEYLRLETTDYNIGLHYPVGAASAETYLSAFDYGEGFTGEAISKGNFADFEISGLDKVVRSGPAPELKLLLAGRNNLTHRVIISVGPDAGSLRQLQEVEFGFYFTKLVEATLQWSDISVAGNMIVRVLDAGYDGAADRVSVSFIKLDYADAWDQELSSEKYYYLPEKVNNKSFIQVSNVPAGMTLYDITDEDNIVRIGYNTAGSDINAVIPNTTTKRKLYLNSRTHSVAKIKKVKMRNISGSNADYLMITHKLLRKPTISYQDVPKAYASYRASAAGGGYDTLLMDIDQLFDLFSYGETTSLAIYRFLRFMADNASPKYLLILGKGLNPGYDAYRKDFNEYSYPNLIPTGGYPGSDMVFSAGLLGAGFEPGISTGRISATSSQQLEAYLNKVKEMENTPYNALWRKELIHLSGGKGETEQILFRSYVDNFATIAKGEYLGGDVVTQSKKTNNSVELINVSEFINNGKILMTFFGHSASTATDIEIGYVSNPAMGYNNVGRYPLIIVNGCNAGDMYNSGYGFGEDWINTPDKGAVGFMAHTGAGLVTRLKRYTDVFYTVGFADSLFMMKGIGDIQKETGRRFLATSFDNEMDVSQVQQFALQGDPATQLFAAPLPDYEIVAGNVFAESIDGQPITAFSEAFNLGLLVRNFGRTNADSIRICINRRLSNGQSIILDTLSYAPVYYQDTLYFKINSVGTDGFGNNQFTIIIDPENDIDEISKSNNTANFEFFVPLGGTSNLLPHNYAIVNKQSITLVSQSLDLLMDDRTFLFEMDTTTSFNSPVKQNGSIQGNVFAKWDVNLFSGFAEQDTIVFYWRSKYADTRPDELDAWSQSSFTYIKDGPTGWAMTHYQQLEEAKSEELVMNNLTREWEFRTFETSVEVKTFGALYPGYDNANVELFINGITYNYESNVLCTDNSINMVAFDRGTTLPYLVLSVPHASDRRSCGRTPQVINNFLKSEIESQLRLETYINNVEDGDFVLLFSMGEVTYQSWPASTITRFEEIGVQASDIQSLLDGYPLIILGKKGSAPGDAIVIVPDPASPTPETEQMIELNEMINGQVNVGTVETPLIGPTTSWTTFIQTTDWSDNPAEDQYSFDIIGINDQGNEVLLNSSITAGEVDLTGIDPGDYRSLKLRLHLSDEANYTPPQLKKWMLIYDEVPEGIISLKSGQPVSDVELSEGEDFSISYEFENISDLPFTDSIDVQFILFNQPARKSRIDTLRIKPLAPDEKADILFGAETYDWTGVNDVRVFANPYILPEQNYNNNTIYLSEYLNVIPDEVNPILEVTVDGQFILDGDIVSPDPLIVMRVKDENKIFLKEDTTGVELYLKRPCEECDFERISFSSPNVVWTPATAESDFRVEYQPGQLEDGIYTIKAQASDASGNKSGTTAYTVSFEVINESQITNFFPYPNPFSSSTRFVFTLTGSEIPDQIIIQIMTVNGTVVREITQDEIGPIRIGNNKTQYAWDGKDEYGDQLANGVYLYRVKVLMHGEDIKLRPTSADKAFKHGFGKMYLLR